MIFDSVISKENIEIRIRFSMRTGLFSVQSRTKPSKEDDEINCPAFSLDNVRGEF